MGCSQSAPKAPVNAHGPAHPPAPLKEAPTAHQEPVLPAPGAKRFSLHPWETRPLVARGEDTMTIPALFKLACARKPDAPALMAERPVPPPEVKDGAWKTWTFAEYLAESRAIAKGLLALEVKPHDVVTWQGSNQPEVFVAHMATMLVRACPAGLYLSDSPANVSYKLRHVGARVAFVETMDHAQQLASLLDQLPRLCFVVVTTPEAVMPSERFFTRFSDETKVTLLSWKDLMTKGQTITDGELDLVTDAAKPEECCIIIFTSGTTGLPKAVMLAHDAVFFEIKCILGLIPALQGAERELSYLPLSHVAGFVVDVIAPVAIAATTDKGYGTIMCARSYDLKQGTLADRLKRVRPTVFVGVPRVWEKMESKIREHTEHASVIARALAGWAQHQALATQQNRLVGGTGEPAPWIDAADALVLKRVRHAVGLDECKFELSASAPLAMSTLQFFASLGISIKQAYGTSECTGACTMETEEAHLWGSVGFAMPDSNVAILDAQGRPVEACKDLLNPSDAQQGEICFRGRYVMLGYMAAFDGSDEKAMLAKNEECFTADGYMRSGDKGCHSETGFFRITGRFKELIKTAGGEYVSPVPIEEAIAQRVPAISKIMVIGDKRPYNVALITLQQQGATVESPGNGKLAGLAVDVSPNSTTVQEAMEDPEWEKYLASAIDAVNKDPSVCRTHAFSVQKFTICPSDFSLQGEELTPALKLRRGFVENKFKRNVEDMYASHIKDVGSPFENWPVAYCRWKEHASSG